MSDTVEYFQDDENASARLLDLVKNVKRSLDISISNERLPFLINYTSFIVSCKGLLEKDVRIRCILQALPKSTQDYKLLSSIVSELKYLEGIEGISAISDSEYFFLGDCSVNPQLQESFSTNNQIVLSAVKKSFDTLFRNSISFLETSSHSDDEYKILPPALRFKADAEISDQIVHFMNDSEYVYIYSSIGEMLLGYHNYSNQFEEILKKHKLNKHKGIRWLTSIRTKNDLRLVRDLIQQGIEIRHSVDRPPFDFAISDKYFACTIERNEEDKMILDNMLLNDDRANLTFYNMIFEKLWNSAMDAEERIKEIERRIDDSIDIVYDSNESLHRLFELFVLAKHEVLIILPSTNGFFRTEMSGGFNMLNRMGNKGIKIRVLTLRDEENVSEINKIKAKYPNISFKDLEQTMASFNRILVFDKDNTVIWEVKDDDQLKFTEALGKAIFIEGNKTSETISSIFNSLWSQSEVYSRLKEAHKKLKSHDKMQSRFMDLVAHELRTPLQSILGFTEVLSKDIKNSDQHFILHLVMSNARKLQRLSENILDITRLEGNIMYLNKEEFNLNELVKSIVADHVTHIEYNKSITFEYKDFENEYLVYADKFRISQVIQNIIDNSIRFTRNKGRISLTLSHKTVHSKKIVVLSVADNGEVLRPELLSRLFTKFSSDSYYGAGIGLFLCRRIVEAHNGRIWAINNKSEGGCTFSFGIPSKG
jgi:signal transduction histidine kinase